MPTIPVAASSAGDLAQAVQVLGALLVLAAFVSAQLRRLRTTSPAYLWLNLLGSATLAVLAALGPDWGFLLLEGSWALVSAAALLRRPGDRASRRRSGTRRRGRAPRRSAGRA